MGMAKKTERGKKSKENILIENPLDIYFDGLTKEELALLRKRARKLSHIPEEKSDSFNLEVLEFMLGGEHYALETKFISETLRLKDFTPLPTAPKFLFGIMNLRGNIISIINLKEFFELGEEKLNDLNRVLVMKRNDLIFGILAEEVIGFTYIEKDKLTGEIHTIKGVREEYLLGVSPSGLIVLDGNKILNDKKLIIEN